MLSKPSEAPQFCLDFASSAAASVTPRGSPDAPCASYPNLASRSPLSIHFLQRLAQGNVVLIPAICLHTGVP